MLYSIHCETSGLFTCETLHLRINFRYLEHVINEYDSILKDMFT